MGVVAELEMAEEEAVDAFSKGDGRPRVEEEEGAVFRVFVFSLAGPDDEVGREDEEGAMGCAIGTAGTMSPSARDRLWDKNAGYAILRGGLNITLL